MRSRAVFDLEERLRHTQPALVYDYGAKLEISVFRVKRLHDPCWGAAPLYSLLRVARSSYLRYGQIEPLDEYDQKAVIYAALASYSKNGKRVSEWLSLRFVPYGGTPRGIEDIGFYCFNGRPVKGAIKRKVLQPACLTWKDCVSGSRICGINPSETGDGENASKHNRFAGVCFAAMHRQFFSDYPEFKVLISQIPDSFLENVLKTPGLAKPCLTTAAKALGCADSRVKLNRNNRYIYNFPMYFLNPSDVLALLRGLYVSGDISEATLIHYFGNRLNGSMARAGDWPPMEKLNNLGLLFSAEGRIYGSKLTGEDVRGMLDAAKDGPKLRIVRMPYLKRIINKMLGH